MRRTVHALVGLPVGQGRKDRMKTEKERRIYYQDIVYHVCYALDLIDGKKPGHGIVCGTAYEPNTDVFDRMKALVQEVHDLRDDRQTKNAASEGTGASPCSACAQLRQDLQDVTWDRDSLKRAIDRWIEDCRRARAAVVEMMAHGARAEDAAMLERWDAVQRIEIAPRCDGCGKTFVTTQGLMDHECMPNAELRRSERSEADER